VKINPDEMTKWLIVGALAGSGDIPPLRASLNEFLTSSDPVHELEIAHFVPHTGQRTISRRKGRRRRACSRRE
jgi:hypothetical protein